MVAVVFTDLPSLVTARMFGIGDGRGPGPHAAGELIEDDIYDEHDRGHDCRSDIFLVQQNLLCKDDNVALFFSAGREAPGWRLVRARAVRRMQDNRNGFGKAALYYGCRFAKTEPFGALRIAGNMRIAAHIAEHATGLQYYKTAMD
jgi:hypothetical protein